MDASLVPQKGIFVYSCFKWMCLTLSSDEDKDFFPWHDAVEADGRQSTYFLSRIRDYMTNRMRISGSNLPLLVHSLALMDAHQLNKHFKCWKIYAQSRKALDRRARVNAKRAYFRRWHRFQQRISYVDDSAARVKKRHMVLNLARIWYAWQLTMRLDTFSNGRVGGGSGKLRRYFEKWISNRRHRSFQELSLHNGHRLFCRKHLYNALELWIAYLSKVVSTRQLLPIVLNKTCILMIVYNNWWTTVFVRSALFQYSLMEFTDQELLYKNTVMTTIGECTKQQQQHKQQQQQQQQTQQPSPFAPTDINMNASVDAAAPAANYGMLKKDADASSTFVFSKAVHHRLAMYVMDPAFLPGIAENKYPTAPPPPLQQKQTYTSSNFFPHGSDECKASQSTPHRHAAHNSQSTRRGVYGGVPSSPVPSFIAASPDNHQSHHLIDDTGIEPFATPGTGQHKFEAHLSQEKNGNPISHATSQYAKFSRGMPILRGNLGGMAAQKLSVTVGDTYYACRLQVYCLRQWLLRTPQMKLDNPNNVPTYLPRTLSPPTTTAALFSSPLRRSNLAFPSAHYVTGDYLSTSSHFLVNEKFVQYFNRLSLQRGLRKLHTHAISSSYLRKREAAVRSKSVKAQELQAFGGWLVVAAATERVNRIANRILCNRIKTTLWHTFFSWRSQFERVALLKSNQVKLLQMRNKEIKEFVENNSDKRKNRSQQEILLLWSLTTRDRKRGRILTELWKRSAGRRHLWRAMRRWEVLVDLHAIVTCFKRLWRGHRVRKVQYYNRYRYLKQFKINLSKLVPFICLKRRRRVFRFLQRYRILALEEHQYQCHLIVYRRYWTAIKHNRIAYKQKAALNEAIKICMSNFELAQVFRILRHRLKRKRYVQPFVQRGNRYWFGLLKRNCRVDMKTRRCKTMSVEFGHRQSVKRAFEELQVFALTCMARHHKAKQVLLYKKGKVLLRLLQKVRDNKTRRRRIANEHGRKCILFSWLKKFRSRLHAVQTVRRYIRSYDLVALKKRYFTRMILKVRERMYGNAAVAMAARLNGKVLLYTFGFKRGRGLGVGVPTSAKTPRFMVRGRVRRYFTQFRRFLSNLRRQRSSIISESKRQYLLKLEFGFSRMLRAWSNAKSFSFGTGSTGREGKGKGIHAAAPRGRRHNHHLASGHLAPSASLSQQQPIRPHHAPTVRLDQYGVASMSSSSNWRRRAGILGNMSFAPMSIVRTSWPHLNRYREDHITAASRALHVWLRRTRLLRRGRRALQRINHHQVSHMMYSALAAWATYRWRRRRRYVRAVRVLTGHSLQPLRKAIRRLLRNSRRRRVVRRGLEMFAERKLKQRVVLFMTKLKKRCYFNRFKIYTMHCVRRLRFMALFFITRLRRTTQQKVQLAKEKQDRRLKYHAKVRAVCQLVRYCGHRIHLRRYMRSIKWARRNHELGQALRYWYGWWQLRKKLGRTTRRFYLKPSFSLWFKSATTLRSYRLRIRTMTMKIAKHTRGQVFHAWRGYAVLHAKHTRLFEAVEAKCNRRRRKYVVRAWLKAVDDSISRTKFEMVRDAHAYRLRKASFLLWHKASLLSELSTYNSAQSFLRSWRRMVKLYRVQRSYCDYAERLYQVYSVKSYLRRWHSRSVALGYVRRRQRKLFRMSEVKIYLRNFRKWKRRMYLVAREKYVLRSPQHRNTRIFAALRCLKIWRRVARLRRGKRKLSLQEKVFRSWRAHTRMQKFCRQAFVSRLQLSAYNELLRAGWKGFYWNREKIRLHSALSTYQRMITSHNVWFFWRQAYEQRVREKRLMNLVLYHLYSARVHAMFLTWKVRTFCRAGQLVLQQKAWDKWRRLYKTVRHSSHHIMHRVFRGWRKYVTTVSDTLYRLMVRRRKLWNITHRHLRDTVLLQYLAFRKWKVMDASVARIKLHDYHKYRPSSSTSTSVPLTTNSNLVFECPASSVKHFHDTAADIVAVFASLADNFGSVLSHRAYEKYLRDHEPASEGEDGTTHQGGGGGGGPLGTSRKNWQKLFNSAASTSAVTGSALRDTAATSTGVGHDDEASKIRSRYGRRLSEIKQSFFKRHHTSSGSVDEIGASSRDKTADAAVAAAASTFGSLIGGADETQSRSAGQQSLSQPRGGLSVAARRRAEASSIFRSSSSNSNRNSGSKRADVVTAVEKQPQHFDMSAPRQLPTYMAPRSKATTSSSSSSSSSISSAATGTGMMSQSVPRSPVATAADVVPEAGRRTGIEPETGTETKTMLRGGGALYSPSPITPTSAMQLRRQNTAAELNEDEKELEEEDYNYDDDDFEGEELLPSNAAYTVASGKATRSGITNITVAAAAAAKFATPQQPPSGIAHTSTSQFPWDTPSTAGKFSSDMDVNELM